MLQEREGMTIENQLQKKLFEEIEQSLPSSSGALMLCLMNPAAPVIQMSRAAGTADLTVPVFFIAFDDESKLYRFMCSLYDRTKQLAKLSHIIAGPQLHFLIVPAMFHMIDTGAFVSAMREVLDEYHGSTDFAWIQEDCEVVIHHNGRVYKAVRSGEGLRVVATD